MATLTENCSLPKATIEEWLYLLWEGLSSDGFLRFCTDNNYSFYGDYYDPYAGLQPYASESANYRLEDKTTGRILELYIRQELFRNSPSEMTLTVQGEESEIERFKRAYDQMLLLKAEQRKQKNIVRLFIRIRLGVPDPNPNRKRVRWQNKYGKEYLFQPPSKWFAGQELPPEKLSFLLEFIKKNELKCSGYQSDHACEIVSMSVSYESSLDLYEDKLEKLFIVEDGGEIKKSSVLQQNT